MQSGQSLLVGKVTNRLILLLEPNFELKGLVPLRERASEELQHIWLGEGLLTPHPNFCAAILSGPLPQGERALQRAPQSRMAINRAHTSSGHGTIVDLTVFIAIASATAAVTPSSAKGQSG